MIPEKYNIVYSWWCLICQTYHFYPERCPFDDMDDEEEEYYYSIR